MVITESRLVQLIKEEVLKLYHGSPYNFDKFDAEEIGTGEGGSKGMRGMNFSEKEHAGRSPFYANLRSKDKPIKLGVPRETSKTVDPRIYTVLGNDINLCDIVSAKHHKQEDLEAQGYDGVRIKNLNQITIFPRGLHKLTIDKKETIEEFILDHPEIEHWSPWTTDEERLSKLKR